MKSESSPQGEATVSLLQEAHRNGASVPIPGAFEMRVRARAAALSQGIDVRLAPDAPATADSDRERLEHEREGGGAPSQRAGTRRGTMGTRLWQSVLRPMRLSDIWRRAPFAIVKSEGEV